MKHNEYETELKFLYGKAMKVQDFRLAFDILEVGRNLIEKDMDLARTETEEIENG